jgi:hypothetical protein
MKDQILTLHSRRVFELLLPRLVDQLIHSHPLQLGQVCLAQLDLLVALVNLVVVKVEIVVIDGG